LANNTQEIAKKLTINAFLYGLESCFKVVASLKPQQQTASARQGDQNVD
jgi:hypothetical protein